MNTMNFQWHIRSAFDRDVEQVATARAKYSAEERRYNVSLIKTQTRLVNWDLLKVTQGEETIQLNYTDHALMRLEQEDRYMSFGKVHDFVNRAFDDILSVKPETKILITDDRHTVVGRISMHHDFDTYVFTVITVVYKDITGFSLGSEVNKRKQGDVVIRI